MKGNRRRTQVRVFCGCDTVKGSGAKKESKLPKYAAKDGTLTFLGKFSTGQGKRMGMSTKFQLKHERESKIHLPLPVILFVHLEHIFLFGGGGENEERKNPFDAQEHDHANSREPKKRGDSSHQEKKKVITKDKKPLGVKLKKGR